MFPCACTIAEINRLDAKRSQLRKSARDLEKKKGPLE
jgi:hypothetical protein